MTKRTILVTGAGRGIGRAIATQFAALGHRIAITARSHEQLTEVAAAVEAAGGESLTLPDDLADREAPARLVRGVIDHWGTLDILVNNAGVGSSGSPKPLVEFDDAYWDLSLAINVTAPYLLIKAALPRMLANQWGRIINIASINSRTAPLHGAAYAASKHAIGGLTKAVATDYPAKLGVTCNAVCPGVVATQMNDLRLDYDVERTGTAFAAIEAQASPLGRRMLPDEIAPMAVFLGSDAANAINGQLINVCAGTLVV